MIRSPLATMIPLLVSKISSNLWTSWFSIVLMILWIVPFSPRTCLTSCTLVTLKRKGFQTLCLYTLLLWTSYTDVFIGHSRGVQEAPKVLILFSTLWANILHQDHQEISTFLLHLQLKEPTAIHIDLAAYLYHLADSSLCSPASECSHQTFSKRCYS